MNERFRELAEEAKIQMCSHERLQEYGKLIVEDILEMLSDTRNYNKFIYTTHDYNKATAVAAELANAIQKKFEIDKPFRIKE